MTKPLQKLLLLSCLLILTKAGYAQKPTPTVFAPQNKIGLTLSGGGAKGLAYVGLLKKIDSLGIKVSYVTGTSMGGIMGGLYAMGYTGKQLEDIINHIDWARVLSNGAPLSQINIEEKSEYGNYLFETPVKNGMPSLPVSLIEGQFLCETLNTITFPRREVTDFSKLFIPLQIATSDIVNGGSVIQRSGSLPLAIRASMSIPAVFSNVHIDGRTLVDGGITRNYPVEEVKKMGAGYVIGGYTGFHLLTDKQMDSPVNQLMQIFAFSGEEDAEKQLRNTNLLVNYTDVLDGYSAADFAKYKEILARGEIAAQNALPQLEDIARKQKAAGIVLERQELTTQRTPNAAYNFMTEKNEPIQDAEELNMLQKQWTLKPGRYYDVDEVNHAIHLLYGSRFYSKVFYTFSNSPTGLQMNIHVTRAQKGNFKTAVHYDTDQSAGIILNYTYYDLLLKRSRVLLTADVTERFKARLGYYKFISGNNKLWVKANAEYRNLKSNDVILSLLSTRDLQTPPPDYFTRTINTEASLGFTFNPSTYVEAGAGYENEGVYKSSSLAANILGLKTPNTAYSHFNETLFLRLVQNTMTSQYYPVKGNKLEVEMKYSFDNRESLNDLQVGADSINISQYLDPNSALYAPPGLPGNVFRISVEDQWAIPVAKVLTIKIAAMAGVNSSTRFGTAGDSYLYLNNYFRLGGIDERGTNNNVNFVGLKQGEVPLRGLSSFTLSAQYMPVSALYVIPSLSYVAESNGYNVIANLFDKNKSYVGYGLHLGYLSAIGPVDLMVSKANISDGLSFPWRAYLSFGYKF